MSLNRIYAVMLRQVYLMRGSLTRLFPLVIWVSIDIVLWGFITRYLNNVASPGFNFVPAMLGAVLLWDFFTRVMHGVIMAFLEDVWTRNFLNIFASPLTRGEYIIGLVLSSIATSIVGLAAMLVIATCIFGLNFLTYGILIVPFLLILFLFGIALGIIGSAIVLRLGPAAEWFAWPIPALVSPFACVFYPVAVLPSWMQCVARALPPSYVFESMRTIISGGSVPATGLLWGAGLALGYIVLACLAFARVYRYAIKSGLTARYSAESLS